VAYHSDQITKPDNQHQKQDPTCGKNERNMVLPSSALQTEFICINSEMTLSGY